MNRGTVARIDPIALQHNLHTIKQQAPHSRVWAVVKADGYGHGAIACASALSHPEAIVCPDGFAVATLQEAKSLRLAGITQPILMLEGAASVHEVQQAAELALTLMIHQAHQIDWLKSLGSEHQIAVLVKVDTGMHRLGIAPDNVTAIVNQLSSLPQVGSLGITSHFACSDDQTHPMNHRQIALFSTCAPEIQPRSLANSAAIWNFPGSQLDWIRPGIALYGASPVAGKSAAALNLLPVMTLTAPIIAERWVETGEPVGYACTWRASRRTRVATLAIGYADGYPRHAPSGTPIWICGDISPLIGRVSMDMITIDVTDIPEATVDCHAELWGKHLPVDEVAATIGTISYELLTRVSPRVPRL